MLFGHDAAQLAFRDALASGRMHHAWLLTGQPSIGKATLAYRMARHILGRGCAPDDPTDPVFRRIAHGSHADLLTLEREIDLKTKKQKREITVDQVREVTGFMHLTPGEGGWRVVLVDGVEDMNRNAANALLKTLEEPPKRAILLLTSDAPGRLLPTIRSRCRRLPLDTLEANSMGDALSYLLPALDPAARAGLAAIAGGAPGRAVAMAEEGALAIADLVRDVLAQPRLAVGRAFDVADKVTRGEEAFGTFMTLLRDGVADLVRTAARDGRLATRHRPLAEWGEVWHALGHLQVETDRFNLDKRTAVVAGLHLLTKAALIQ